MNAIPFRNSERWILWIYIYFLISLQCEWAKSNTSLQIYVCEEDLISSTTRISLWDVRVDLWEVQPIDMKVLLHMLPW